jgi:SAM-dependent methyltransferase
MSAMRQEFSIRSHDQIVAHNTWQYYENHAQEYALSIPSQVTGAMKEWIDVFVADLPRGASIFEVGSGTGRDAIYLESLGFKVQRSDIASPFIKAFDDQGFAVQRFDVLKDNFPGRQQVVFANSVLCHMTNRQLHTALKTVHDALVPGGRFGFNTKSAPVSWNTWGGEERGPGYRYFSHWPPAKLFAEVERIGFEVVWWSERPAILRPTPWVNLVVRKRPT